MIHGRQQPVLAVLSLGQNRVQGSAFQRIKSRGELVEKLEYLIYS